MAGPRTQPQDLPGNLKSEDREAQAKNTEGQEISLSSSDGNRGPEGASSSLATAGGASTGAPVSAPVEGIPEISGPAIEAGIQDLTNLSVEDLTNRLFEIGAKTRDQFAGKTPDQLAEELLGLSDGEVSLIEERTPGAGFMARTIVNLGRDPDERKRLLKSVLGKGFEVSEKDGELIFRKKGEKKFRMFDPGTVDGFFNKLSEFAKDITADISGEAIEAGTAIGAEALGATAGATAGAAGGASVGGIPGAAIGATLGGGAGLLAGAAAGGAAGAVAREEAIAQYIDPSVDLGSEAAMAAGFNVATLGMATAVRPLLKKARGALKEAFKEAPLARVKQAAENRRGVKNIFEELGMEPGLPSPRTVGEEVIDSVRVQNKRLGGQVGLVLDIAEKKAQGQIQRVDSFLNATEEFLGNSGAKFATDPETGLRVAKLEKEARLGLGLDASKIDKVVDVFNRAQSQGGLELRDLRKTLQDIDKFGFPKGELREINYQFRELGGALASDRNTALKTLTKGTPEESLVDEAFQEYSKNIDIIREAKRKYRLLKSPEKFTKSLIQNQNSETVRQFKGLLGPNSEEWKHVRGTFFTNLFEDSVNPITGELEEVFLERQLKKLGPDSVRELMTEGQESQLKFIIRKSKGLSLADIKDPGVTDQLKAMAVGTMGKKIFPQQKVALLLRAIGANRRAAQYLTNEGLEELADKAAKTPTQKKEFLKVIGLMREQIRMQKTKTIRTKGKEIEIMIPTAESAQLLSTFGRSVEREIENEVQGNQTFNQIQESVGSALEGAQEELLNQPKTPGSQPTGVPAQ